MFTPPFPLSGLADEAADDIAGQIAAHQALGWKAIELRLLNGKQFSGPAVSDDEFKRSVDQLEAAGIRVSSYASAIGNWSRPITGDFSVDLADLKVLIPRMQRTGTKFVRTMSWVRGATGLMQGAGNPAAAIIQHIESDKFAMVVMGTHGHTGLKDILFGTTVDKLRHKISIPLLIVK